MAVVDEQGAVAYSASGADPDGNSPTPDDAFRIGSITKLFTSILTLMLVDEGLVSLDSPADEYVARVSVPDGVYGHGGGIVGYQTFVSHVAATGTTAFFAITNDTLSFEQVIEPIQERISQG